MTLFKDMTIRCILCLLFVVCLIFFGQIYQLFVLLIAFYFLKVFPLLSHCFLRIDIEYLKHFLAIILMVSVFRDINNVLSRLARARPMSFSEIDTRMFWEIDKSFSSLRTIKHFKAQNILLDFTVAGLDVEVDVLEKGRTVEDADCVWCVLHIFGWIIR